MFKKIMTLLVLVSFMFVACNKDNATDSGSTSASSGSSMEKPWKIGIMTGTVAQNEEEYRAAQNVLKKYGDEHVILMTYPDKFQDEQETTVANLASMAADPDVGALIICQGVPGTSAAIDKAREINPDLLILVGTPGEDPGSIAARADIVFAANELAMGHTVIEQAKKMGAKTFVHYTFPRHMSYALLAARRDLFRENCEKNGIQFVDATALDPTSDAGLSAAQQFILEDTPRLIEKYGKDTAFFSTNCGLQVPLIKAVFEGKAIYPQPCCPSPYHGFPSALNIKIPETKQGDIPFLVDEIRKVTAAGDMTGRMSTWAIPVAMMFIEAGAEYCKGYIQGDFTEKFDMGNIKKYFDEYAGVKVEYEPLNDNGKLYKNYIFVLIDYVNF
ncbi:MAG: hypothetical protein CR988_07385 [Treponema sp.]|nr:MAG: hypothetical protein CR988_07385 [Treponema sp.]